MKGKSVWVIVWLIGAYVMCQLVADIGATKFVEVAGVTLPAGTFIFALTFTLRDLVHKRLGKQWAQAAIVAAAAFNVFLAGYLWLMSQLTAPVWFALADSWNAIFAIVPAITIGSIAAEMVSELVDTEVYQFWANRFAHLPQWSRVLVSNLISVPIDSVVFSLLAFALLPPLFGAESMSLGAALGRAAGGQIIYKAAVAVVSMPLIYLVKNRSEKIAVVAEA